MARYASGPSVKAINYMDISLVYEVQAKLYKDLLFEMQLSLRLDDS
jgi:hypothetical protein